IEDDTETNRIRVTLGLELPANMVAMSGFREELEVFNSTLQWSLPSRMNSARSEPLALPGSVHLEHRIRIETPGRSLPPPPSDVMTAPGVRYERAFQSSADTLEMRFNLRVDARAAPASAIREVSDISDAIARDGKMRVRVGDARSNEELEAAAALTADPVTQAIDEIRALMAEDDEVTALTLTNRLLADTEALNDVQRGGLLQLKGMLLIRLNRNTAALTPLREGLQLSPADAPAPYFMLIGALGKAQRIAEVPAVFTDLLTHHPFAITTLHPRFVNRLLRELRNEALEAERTEMLLALAAAITATPDADAHPYQYLLAEAVRTTSARPELGNARAIASRIEQPQLIAQLLTDRTTERIWDELETASGTALEQSIERYLERAERDAETHPDDYQILTRLLRAFRIAGRPEDAVAAGTAAVADWARIEAVAEDAYWFVNEYAYALREAERLDEATALLVRLTDLGVEENTPLINMSINLASLLLAAERYEAVLEQIEVLESLQHTPASDIGWMWMYANRACALYRLGRVEEAERELAETMAEVRDSNPEAETK
ncbi:MAG: hypothetical protein MK142_10970, partial [Pseudomonadales bacterium]|nr:hypothetical protein [Pseudomonadales bacterium]